MQDRQPLATTIALVLALVCGLLGACESTAEVPVLPTWADVEPILRGNCTGCHGATAAITGSGSGMSPYRLDFYDMTAESCGEAAAALAGQTLAHGWAKLIAADLTSPGSGWRPRMPPAPGPPLLDWERETVMRWAAQTDPPRGEPRRDNRRPDIQLEAPSGAADKRLAFTAVISDADGEAVVGSLEVGDLRLFTDHAGAFGADIDTSSWTAGLYPIRAVLCDGWDDVTYDLGTVLIRHAISTPK